MPEITHLQSQRKQHLTNHFELRGAPEIGYDWWLVFSKSDHPPEFVGKERCLPNYARDQLPRLRSKPDIGQRRKARYINASLMFFPGSDDNGIPHNENVEWLRQYKRPQNGEYQEDRGYLVVLAHPCNEDYPLEIWESRIRPWSRTIDELDSEYCLVWKVQEDDD